MLYVRRVQGPSMLPALRPGRVIVLVRRRTYKTGDIVMLRHDNLEKLKRVTQVRGQEIFVQGDNSAASTDGRHFGWLPARAIRAKLLWPKTSP